MRTRAFTSGLGLGRVLFNDLYRYTFFFFFLSARHRRAAGTFFFFVGNQELIRSEAPALFEIAGDTRQVHIFLRRRNRRGT